MNTGKAITAKVRELLREAKTTGKNLYVPSRIPGGNPLRIIRVITTYGLTVAKTITGGEIPVTDKTEFYIQ